MAKRPTKVKDESELLTSLRFVSLAQTNEGTPYQTHCRFINNQIIAFNGVLAAGVPVETELSVCPHTFQLIRALERAKGQHSISVLDTRQLSVTTSRFRALVPCMLDSDLAYVTGDVRQWPLNDAFRHAAEAALMFTSEGSTVVAYASAITRDGSIVGTDGRVFIEAWHGIPTPPGLLIPKQFFAALSKVNKTIAGFGFGQTSFTVWFEDNSWLRSQLYVNETVPNLDIVFEWASKAKPTEIPKDLFAAIEAVAPFNDAGRFHIGDGLVSSHENIDQGATYTVKTMEPAGEFVSKQFLALRNLITKIDLYGNDRAVLFFGGNDKTQIRGAFAKIRS